MEKEYDYHFYVNDAGYKCAPQLLDFACAHGIKAEIVDAYVTDQECLVVRLENDDADMVKFQEANFSWLDRIKKLLRLKLELVRDQE